MKFNEKIVRLRKIKGITQDEFASAVGVSRQAVYKWESGQSYPEVAKLLEIKLLFGISIDDLLDENYEIEMPEKKKRKRLNRAQIKAVEAEVEKELSESKQESALEEISRPKEEPVSAPTVAETEAETVIEEKEPAMVISDAAEKSEEASVEETAPVSNETEEIIPMAEPAVKKNEETPAKKVGFFGRIFGRK